MSSPQSTFFRFFSIDVRLDTVPALGENTAMFHKNHALFAVAGLVLLVSGSLYAQTPQDLRFGAITSGNLTKGGERWYRVRPIDLGLVSVETSGNLDTYLEVYDAAENRIAYDDDGGEEGNARLELVVEAGKIYLFKLRGYDETEVGSYHIWANFRAIPPATELRFGNEVSGNLSSGGDQWFSVRPSGPGFVVVQTFGSLDTCLRVYDDSYQLVDENDDSEENENACLDMFVESGKTYFFRVTGYSGSVVGPYRLLASFDPIPPDTARNTERSRAVPLRLGESLSVIFYTTSESRWFRYDIPREGTVFIVQTRGRLDTELFLYDARGNLVAENDDGGEETNALITQRLGTGTFYIEVKRYDGGTDRCTLHAEIR